MQKKTITITTIRTLSPRNNRETFIKQKPETLSTIIKASDFLTGYRIVYGIRIIYD